MLVVEHNLDVIKTADWVIDLGPGGGVNGGKIIAEGPPEKIAEASISATGQYLRPMLERASVKPVIVATTPTFTTGIERPGIPNSTLCSNKVCLRSIASA